MSRLAIAALQLELPAGNNLEVICEEIAKAVRRYPWIELMVIGELATFGSSTDHAQPVPTLAEQIYRDCAREHGIWLIPGSLYESDRGAIYNTLPVISPSGEILHRYRKMYPFRPYEKGVADGEDFVVFDIPGVARIGVMICYDMWFPEVARTLAWMGSEIILCPSMTNTIDRDLELSMARTLGAINQCYLVNVNVAGQIGNGRSIVVGPDGRVLHQSGEKTEAIALELDIEHVRRVRERGVDGLGQVLKSFRDGPAMFPCYGHASSHLEKLGELTMPQRPGADTNRPWPHKAPKTGSNEG